MHNASYYIKIYNHELVLINSIIIIIIMHASTQIWVNICNPNTVTNSFNFQMHVIDALIKSIGLFLT